VDAFGLRLVPGSYNVGLSVSRLRSVYDIRAQKRVQDITA